ncbi:hypothetical protein NDI44_24045 [Trichocoleus sp. DQ-A3]|uniref:hypothetical protein n=1 Tax=Cyanophyceae TaxID=3028117 RepID=UPI0016852CB8|nr:hypothetical protein [Coleofasciculus sp. FACHB-125]MBD1902552.1 hypothetical protein [Coleofasciculus sp. FACHB-125]
MHTIKSLGWVVGLSIVALGMAAPARADRSYSDITGTNIWNNTAPVFDTDDKLDPELTANITRLNQESEAAFQACGAALTEQTPTTRRFTRQPQTPPPVPQACQRLEELRTEVENLRTTLQQQDLSRANSGLRTW